METKNLLNKKITQWLLLVAMLLGCNLGVYAGDAGFFSTGMWEIHFWDGSDHWDGFKDNDATYDLGIKTTLYLKGSNVKTWSDSDWGQYEVNFKYSIGSNSENWTVTNGNKPTGNQTWTYNSWDADLISKAPNNPGNNTVDMQYVLDKVRTAYGHFTFTIPGFANVDTPKAFGDVSIGYSKSQKITFNHYGNALDKNDCELSDTDNYEINSIDESGVDVKFKPKSAGSKPCTLKITDDHGKSTTITISGTGVATDLYLAGDFNGWNTESNENKMSYSNGIYTITKSIDKQTDNREFKISSYNWSDTQFCKNSSNFSRNSNSHSVTASTGGSNIEFAADATGNYTFTLDAYNRQLTITYPPLCSTPSKAQSIGTFTYGACDKITVGLGGRTADKMMLVMYEGANQTPTKPTDGTSYSVGDEIGNGTVVDVDEQGAQKAGIVIEPDKKYTFALYQYNDDCHYYSDPDVKTTGMSTPEVTTADASVDGATATLGGTYVAQGKGAGVEGRGIEWTRTVGDKTAGTREGTSGSISVGASFSKDITFTQSGTYYYKAYVYSNAGGTCAYGYGEEKSVTVTVCPTPTVTVSGDATVETGSQVTYTATANAGTGESISTYEWNTPTGWTKGTQTNNQITYTVGSTTGSATVTCTVTNSCGNTATDDLGVTVIAACTEPVTVQASGVYNNDESPWKDTFADGHRSAVLTATPTTAKYYQWYGCDADGNNQTTTPANVQFSNADKNVCTATFNLPGTYYFVCKASCSAISGSSPTSNVVTVNVPYPEMGVDGQFMEKNGDWSANHCSAGQTIVDGVSGKMTRNGLTWTGVYKAYNPGGEFVIIQRYKYCTNSPSGADCPGWCGYEECGGNYKGGNNKINYSTNSMTGMKYANGNVGDNFVADNIGISTGDNIRITVTMTGYDSYTLNLEKVCVAPENLYLRGPIFADDNGCWPPETAGYYHQMSKSGNVYTLTFRGRTDYCQWGTKEFVVTTVQGPEQSAAIRNDVFSYDSSCGKGTGDYNFQCNLDYSAGTNLTVQITWISCNNYSMTISKQCVTPNQLSLKGPLVSGDWETWIDATGSTSPFTFSFNATGAGGSALQTGWFVIASSKSPEIKINGSMASTGNSGWHFYNDTPGNDFIANDDIIKASDTSVPIIITVTYRPSTCDYTMTLEAGCKDPAPGFTISDDWGDKHFADAVANRQVTLTSASGGNYSYNWWTCSDASCTSPQWIEGSYSSTHTAVFTLPGTYHFQSKAGCDPYNLVISAPKTVTIPVPQIGITGNGVAGSSNELCYAAGDGDCGSPAGLTWTKEFTVDDYYGYQVVRIHQRYKSVSMGDCSGETGGWSTSNYIPGSQITIVDSPDGVVVDGAQIQLGSSFNVGDRARITITMTAYNAYTVSITKVCSAPTAGFDITGQLNAGKGSPWEGTTQGTGGCFGDNYRTITLNSTVGSGYQYEWVCTSGNTNIENWWNYGDTQTWENATANIKLPGTYKFKQRAKCIGAPNWVESKEITVVVPFPEMWVNGPAYKGYYDVLTSENSYNMENEGTNTWTAKFHVGSYYNPANLQAFIVSQRYKVTTGNAGLNREENSIYNHTISNPGCTKDWGHYNSAISNPTLIEQDSVLITVTMNAWNDYTVSFQRICEQHWFDFFVGVPTSAICEGTKVNLEAHFDFSYGAMDSYEWEAPADWTLDSQDGWSAEFTAGATSGTVSVTSKLRCNNDFEASSETGSITVIPNLTITVNPASPKAYEVITLGTEEGGNMNWAKTAGNAGAYFVGADGTAISGTPEAAVESIKFKAPAGGYTITATPASGSDCPGTTSITVDTDTEDCSN